ncbi:MAG: hypothetical protein KZQ85_11760 [Candidatus Thiodiazotropha sp. (ex Myrtea sp. 'scaly one' KF741663)]|nr:hypothetical protein [Candidatus Thiodiazotropha sp. (ex Myrtea sp. 'scaly one' KF741663)]
MRKKLFTTLLVFSAFFASLSVAEVKQIASSDGVLLADQNRPGFAFLTPNGRTKIEVIDTNQDQVVDLLRYSIFDSTGADLLEVEDHGIDGILNQRWHKSPVNRFEVWYESSWYWVQGKGEKIHIKTPGGEVPIRIEQGRLVPAAHNK